MGDDAKDPDGGDRLVWADLEMTGLDVTKHRIVEIAVLVTDGDLVPLDDGIDLVVHQPPQALAAMDPTVRKMHARSGLTAAVEAATLDLDEAGAQALAYVRAHVPDVQRAPLCGNSIGVDRRFLDHHLPAIERHLHYRSIDVSSLKELCRRWLPEVYAARPHKEGRHRALDDIRESIEELRYYRSVLFQPRSAPETPATPASG